MQALKLADQVVTVAEFRKCWKDFEGRDLTVQQERALWLLHTSESKTKPNGPAWTQQQLAEETKRIQQWIDYQLRFARFLRITTTVVKLSERRFRSLWQATDHLDDEQARFDCIKGWLKRGVSIAPPKFNTAEVIVKEFGDGRLHGLKDIWEKVNEKCEGRLSKKAVIASLARLEKGLSTLPCRVDKKDARESDWGKKYRIKPTARVQINALSLDKPKTQKLLRELAEVYEDGFKATDKVIAEFCPTEAKECFLRLKGIVDRLKSGEFGGS